MANKKTTKTKATSKKKETKNALDILNQQTEDTAPVQKEIKVKEVKEVNKGGRPSDKDAKTRYKKLTISIPAQTVLRVQIAVPKLRDKGILKTQNALVDIALKEYLDRNKDLLEIE